MQHLDIVSLLLRIVAGSLFLFQGYDKLFKVKIINVARTFGDPIHPSFWMKSLLKPMITLSSLIELVGGLFLILGLFKFYTLSLLSLDLIFVAFYFSAIKPMWDMQFFFPRFIFIIFLWLIPFSEDIYSIDHLIKI